jgi:hypothetical protein
LAIDKRHKKAMDSNGNSVLPTHNSNGHLTSNREVATVQRSVPRVHNKDRREISSDLTREEATRARDRILIQEANSKGHNVRSNPADRRVMVALSPGRKVKLVAL